MKKDEKRQKIEIVIFIILLFLQNFSIITTKSFGIAGITIFLVYVFFRYKLYFKINKKIILVGASFVIFTLLSQFVNHSFNFSQIIRYSMIIFIAWTTIKFIEEIYKTNQKDFFDKVFFSAIMVITIYGVYQLIASKLELPLLFNIFNNNPSYGARGLFESYTGWMNDVRIYTTFYEPSSYALFLTIAYFYIMHFSNLNKDQKFVLTAMTLFNIFFTFARSGWVTFVYYIAIYYAFMLFENNYKLKKIVKIGIVLLPIITLLIMGTLGVYIFKDLSSTGRTYSSIYYLSNTFDSIKGILVGHGLGSMFNIPSDLTYNGYAVENFAHNGYIDILYQFGIPFFILVIYVLLRYIKQKNIDNDWLVYATIFTLCCFGSMYSVESIIILVCLVLISAEQTSNVKQVKEDECDIEAKFINKDDIIVSICCITYNQEKYIRKALDSFINQKTNFKYEVIVHDDASTDNTAKIIKQYEEKYPNIIRGVYEKENQYSLGKWCLIKTCKEARGKYIAICEGDDFWIDENKLQRQVNYLETHPGCTLCFHNATILDMNSNTMVNKFIPQNNDVKKYLKSDNIYNVGELELLGFIPTASFMFRTESLDKLPNWFENCFVQDWPLKLVMTSFGYAYFIDRTMSAYRKNAEGSVTNANEKTEKQSKEGKTYILDKKQEVVDLIDEFTNGEYKEVFDLRRTEYKIEKLMLDGNNKEIIEKNYLQYFDTIRKIKYLLKIYCPNLIKLYKKIKTKIIR